MTIDTTGQGAGGQPLETASPVHAVRILTVNTHKGFTLFNRRFILPELREAVRSVGADVVFLQEVVGLHERHSQRIHNWPPTPQPRYCVATPRHSPAMTRRGALSRSLGHPNLS